MKILILGGTYRFPYGGAAPRCVHMLGKGLVRLGHEVTVLVPEMTNTKLEEIDGIRVVCCRVASEKMRHSKISWLLTRGLFFLECLTRTFPRPRHDWVIVYGHDLVGGLIVPIWKLCGGNVADIQTDIFSETRFKRWKVILPKIYELVTVRGVLYFSSVLFTLSSGLEDYFRKKSPKKKIVRYLSPVDYELFSSWKSLSPIKYRNKESEKLIVFSGGLSGIEGEEILLRAFAKSLQEKKGQELRLVIASGLPTKDQISSVKKLIDELGIGEKVSIVTSLTLVEVVDLLSQADVLVAPKIDHILNHMGMAIKLGEYLASGKPVIATTVGDVGKYLKHMETALLCKPGDVRCLAECINTLVEDRELAERLGRQGKKLAKHVFDIAPNVERISKGLYEALPLRSR